MELLSAVDDRVRLLGLQLLPVVDAAPRDGDRVDAGRLRRTHVERRVAHVRGLVWVCAETLERELQRLRIGLVALGLVAADDDVEEDDRKAHSAIVTSAFHAPRRARIRPQLCSGATEAALRRSVPPGQCEGTSASPRTAGTEAASAERTSR